MAALLPVTVNFRPLLACPKLNCVGCEKKRNISSLDKYIKGTVSRDFLLQVFFHESSSPKPLKISLGSLKFFLEIREDICKSMFTTSINDTGGKFSHWYRRCQSHRWQIMGTNRLYLRVHLKNKIIKTFLIEDFFPFATGVNDTRG